MPLPHFGGGDPGELSDYIEYIYLGNEINANEYVWDKGYWFIHNNKYRLYRRTYLNEGKSNYINFCEGNYEENPKTTIIRSNFYNLIENGLMIEVSNYRSKRIEEILND